ncbi:MAG: hypothetical protein HYX68_19540 [Planctomycetes bacterium]|nr:hypothetical protein [Planctomycetota bacterium]
MTEVITCSECQRKLQVPESFIGQMVQCPECGHQFAAQPNPNAVQAQPPVSSASGAAAPQREEGARRRRPVDEDDDDFDDDYVDIRPMRRSGTPHRGGMILAVGILAWVLFPYTTWICGPIAWFMGNSDLNQIRAGDMDPSGEGMVQAGRVLGMVATIVSVVLIAGICLLIAVSTAHG